MTTKCWRNRPFIREYDSGQCGFGSVVIAACPSLIETQVKMPKYAVSPSLTFEPVKVLLLPARIPKNCYTFFLQPSQKHCQFQGHDVIRLDMPSTTAQLPLQRRSKMLSRAYVVMRLNLRVSLLDSMVHAFLEVGCRPHQWKFDSFLSSTARQPFWKQAEIPPSS